jgi:hypothetical protein
MTKEEADTNLHRAIYDHAMAYSIAESDELISEFAVIANWQKHVADGRSQYSTHFHTPSVPNHVAVGLFAMGQKISYQDD